MTWGAIGGAAVSVVGGSMLGGDKGGSTSNTQAAGTQQAANQDQVTWANNLNKENATWAQQQNQLANDKVLQANRANQTSDFGSLTWEQDPATGQWTQTSSVAPDQEATLAALRQKQSGIVNGMNTGFNVNGDVMQAYKNQMQPGLDQARNTENARLAAMGLSSGSGTAWGNSQDALNRSSNDANDKAVLSGFNADQTLRASNRSDLASLGTLENAMRGNSSMPAYNTESAAQMGQVVATTPTAADWQSANSADAANSANSSAGYANALGKIAKEGINWWNTRDSGDSATNPASGDYSNPAASYGGW